MTATNVDTQVGPDGYVPAECRAAEAHGTFAVQRFTPDPNADAELESLAAFLGIRAGLSSVRSLEIAGDLVTSGWVRPGTWVI